MALGTSDISLSRENIVEKLCRPAWRHSFSFLLVGNAMCRRIIALGGGVRCEAEIAHQPRSSCQYSGRLLPEKYEFGWELIVGGMMLSVRPLAGNNLPESLRPRNIIHREASSVQNSSFNIS